MTLKGSEGLLARQNPPRLTLTAPTLQPHDRLAFNDLSRMTIPPQCPLEDQSPSCFTSKLKHFDRRDAIVLGDLALRLHPDEATVPREGRPRHLRFRSIVVVGGENAPPQVIDVLDVRTRSSSGLHDGSSPGGRHLYFMYFGVGVTRPGRYSFSRYKPGQKYFGGGNRQQIAN